MQKLISNQDCFNCYRLVIIATVLLRYRLSILKTSISPSCFHFSLHSSHFRLFRLHTHPWSRDTPTFATFLSITFVTTFNYKSYTGNQLFLFAVNKSPVFPEEETPFSFEDKSHRRRWDSILIRRLHLQNFNIQTIYHSNNKFYHGIKSFI